MSRHAVSSLQHILFEERGDLDGALALLQEAYRILQLTNVKSEEGAVLLTRLGAWDPVGTCGNQSLANDA